MYLPQELIDEILLRVLVKSLLRFKSVSKKWKATIESEDFQKRQMNYQQSLDPNLLLADGPKSDDVCVIRSLVLGSSISVDLPCPNPPPMNFDFPGIEMKVPNTRVSNSCDGVICFYNNAGEIFVVNPSTRWSRQVHGTTVTRCRWNKHEGRKKIFTSGVNGLGFGKDICTGTYKIVWFYQFVRRHYCTVTTCEVFDFNTNTWRNVEYPEGYETLDSISEDPVCINGSSHWLVKKYMQKSRILCFDFHKETFYHLTSELPTVVEDYEMIGIYNVNNRLCISEKNWPTQNIWLWNDSDDDDTWEWIYSLELPFFPPELPFYRTLPIACPLVILKKKKKKLLLYDIGLGRSLVIYDRGLGSCGKCLEQPQAAHVVPYFPSLISI